VTLDDPGVWNLDLTDEGADWIKRGTWDIPARNIEELRAWTAVSGWTVEEFKPLPVYLWHLADMPWLADL
jgi:hypothetical protein